MTKEVFVISLIIQRGGNCMGIDCSDCPLDDHIVKGYKYPSCSSTNDPDTFTAAKTMLMKLDPSLLFEVML